VPAREGFGTTEVGLATWMLPELEGMYDSGSAGIDAPFRQTTMRDEDGNPVPPGGRGELWVRGARPAPGLLEQAGGERRILPGRRLVPHGRSVRGGRERLPVAGRSHQPKSVSW
jgi:hypothetical protein